MGTRNKNIRTCNNLLNVPDHLISCGRWESGSSQRYYYVRVEDGKGSGRIHDTGWNSDGTIQIRKGWRWCIERLPVHQRISRTIGVSEHCPESTVDAYTYLVTSFTMRRLLRQ